MNQNQRRNMAKFTVLSVLLSIGVGGGFVVGAANLSVDQSSPRVVTKLGPVEGYYKTASYGRKYEAYEGVPYAQPPIGKLRFQVAEKITPWTDVLMAKQVGSTCVQYEPSYYAKPGEAPGIVRGSEDCLFLNIYTAIDASRPKGNGKSTNLLPVIVYIPGGAFQFGSGDQYQPDYLLNEDVTLITMNYRLGPLGFLSTEDDVVPGNMGLKDQVAALRWIKDNIESFGGDPSRITIFGQSAGGVSVHYHMLSKASSGLFQRAISMSGTALHCWAIAEDSLEKAKQLAAIVKCPTGDNQNMVDCLRLKSAEELTAALEHYLPFTYNPFTPFGPVVERVGGENTFIDRSPIDILRSGQIPQDVPWIVSTVSQEGFDPLAQILAEKDLLDEMNDRWEELAPHVLDFNYTIPQKDHAAVAKKIKEYYVGSGPINMATANQAVQMVGDRLFVYDAGVAAQLHARVSQSPVQFYYFSYRGAHSFSDLFTDVDFGVSHFDDLAYVFNVYFDSMTTAKDREMQRVMIDLVVSFATNGKSDVGVEWTKLSNSNTDELPYLHIAGPGALTMESNSDFGKKKFWRSLNFEENL